MPFFPILGGFLENFASRGGVASPGPRQNKDFLLEYTPIIQKIQVF